MKSRILFIGILACGILLCSGCCERKIEPIVPEGDRVVLLEEFTGKGCTNCPQGSREIENLLSIYGDQLVVVSIHAGFFADPAFFPLGQYDLRTDEGEELDDFLGPILFYPVGIVNRKPFMNELQHGANVWAGYVAQEAALDPEVEFTMTGEYDLTFRNYHLVIAGRAKVNVTGPLRVSVMLTENGIVDAQDDAMAGGIVPDYVHRHVLRDMFTPYDGQELAASLSASEEFMVEYNYELPVDWDPFQCSVIAFVSRHSGGDIYVLQAGEAHLVD